MNIQDQIVSYGRGSVVVSASAGCGKTTTMIRRIAELVLSGACNVDELLVVTFTNAAAAEMREKLNTALKAGNDGGRVLEQLFKLESADICTIDSFCSRLLRKYFFEVDVDPNFEIIDESEAAMLKAQAAEAVLSRHYESGDDAFLRLSDVFAGDRTDRELVRMLCRLVDLSSNYADRSAFFSRLADGFLPGGAAERFLCGEIADSCGIFLHVFSDLSRESALAAGDGETLAAMITALEPLASARSVDDWRETFAVFPSFRLKPLKKEEKSSPAAEAHERVKAAKSAFTDEIKRFREKYLTFSEAELREKCGQMRPLLEKLAQLAKETVEAFSAGKSARAMLDFNDVERCAFEILEREELRRELRARYRYVFLDEAQDINQFQEELLAKLAGENEFLVGDVKQCIYRFRGAKPEIFAARCRAQERGPGFFRLSENFRTNAELLEFVNRVFSACMRGDFCSVDYASTERLVGRKSGRVDDGRPAVICNLVPALEREKRRADGLYAVNSEPADEGLEEGVRIVEEITRLVHGGHIVEPDASGNPVSRPIRYSDVAVLVRGKKAFSDGIRGTLRRAGIAVSCDFAYPIMHYAEITMLVNYLRLVDNFRQDVPLVAAAKSPFGNFSADELAEIRVRCPEKRNFCDAMLAAAGMRSLSDEKGPKTASEAAAADCSESDSLSEKCGAFLDRLEDFRRRSKFLSCFDLISAVVRETDYDVFLERGGEGRAARLASFLESIRGKAFTESLSKFLKFIETFSDSFQLAERTSAPDSVLVGTIHKSKGLEYPIVFLAGLGGKFNRADARSLICIDSELGAGMDWYDPAARVRVELPAANAVKRALRHHTVQNELNLLYVAMTRAKYRMVLSGETRGKSQRADVRSADSFLDFILPALEGSGAEVNEITDAEFDRPRGAVPVLRTEMKKYLPYLDFRYPGRAGVPVKSTVTELNARFEEQPLPSARNFFPESGEDAKNRGVAYHKYLEFGNTHIRDLASLEADVESLGEILSAEERACLDREKLLAFYLKVHAPRTPVKILREQPFMMMVPESELVPGGSGERVLVQGKIDLLFVYDDRVEVVDYKLSRLSDEALVRKYWRQVAVYARAASLCTGLPVGGGWLYSFASERLISVKF